MPSRSLLVLSLLNSLSHSITRAQAGPVVAFRHVTVIDVEAAASALMVVGQ